MIMTKKKTKILNFQQGLERKGKRIIMPQCNKATDDVEGQNSIQPFYKMSFQKMQKQLIF